MRKETGASMGTFFVSMYLNSRWKPVSTAVFQSMSVRLVRLLSDRQTDGWMRCENSRHIDKISDMCVWPDPRLTGLTTWRGRTSAVRRCHPFQGQCRRGNQACCRISEGQKLKKKCVGVLRQ